MAFSALMHQLFITFYRTWVSRKGEMQVEREPFCCFCKKLLNPPQGKRMPVVSVFNRLKNKDLLAASQKPGAGIMERQHQWNVYRLPCALPHHQTALYLSRSP